MRKPLLGPILATLLFFSTLGCPALIAQQELDNAAVIKMTKAGLGPDIVAASVKSRPGHYDASPDGLIALKKAGVGDQVISAIVAKDSGATSQAGATGQGSSGFSPAPGTGLGGATAPGGGTPLGTNGLPPEVDSIGLYYKSQDGAWTEVGAEVVNFKTGGALKHIGSAGIVKGDLNGHVAGFHSHLPLQAPAELMLYAPDGVSPGEYQLIRFRSSSDSREFRSLTGGVAHTSGGAARDTAEFTSKKMAPHIYAITLNANIGKGEYGFLPPLETAGGKNVSSSGKIYTFSFNQ
jgi:hypothetical protein